MIRLTVRPLVAAVAAAGLVAPRTVDAAVKASDHAADAAYSAEQGGAWKGENPGEGENPPGMDNGGTGFLPWNFAGGYHVAGGPYENRNHFIAGVDFPSTMFNDLGAPAFGLGQSPVGFSGATTTATRPFAAPMAVGDAFSAAIDTPAFYDDYTFFNYPFAVITFGDETGESTFSMEAGSSAIYGDFNWRYYDANHTLAAGDFGIDAGGDSIAPTATSDGSTIRLEVLSEATGRVTLDGVTLDVAFIGGLPASVTFTLFDNNAVDDEMGDPTGEHAFFFDDLRIDSPGGIAGDFDGNGRVDAADLAQWRVDFGVNAESNADGDDDSDGHDFLIWQQNLGQPGAAAALAFVPEPGSLGLLSATGAALLRRSRHWRRTD
jgi:hypothetical protein